MQKNKRFKLGDVLTITFAHHIHDIYTAFLAPLAPLLIANFGLSRFMFGMLSVGQRIPTLFNPFLGILAEKIRMRYMTIFAPSVTAIAMSLLGVAPSFTYLLILVFISGISSMLFHVPTPVMMKLVSGDKPGRGMSFYMFGGELARTIGPIVITGAIVLWGFEGTYKLIPIGLLSSLILFLRFRTYDLRKGFSKTKDEGSYWDVFKKYLPVLAIIASITFVRGGMKSLFTYYLADYLGEGESMWIGSISLTIVYLSGSVGAMFSGTISDYLGQRTTVFIAALIAPLLLWVFLYLEGLYVYPMLAAVGFFLLAPTPVFLRVVTGLESKHLPFLNGIYMTSNFLMSALATLLTGWSIDRFQYEFTFQLAGIVAFLAIPLSLFIPKSK